MRVPRWQLWMVPVGAIALAARVLAVRATPGYAPRHDDHSYLMHAYALVQTGTYPVFHAGHVPVQTAYRAPGFPVALALADRVFGANLPTERAAQVAIGAAVPLLVGVVARQVWGIRTAVAAALLAALSPVLILFDASLISEPLFIALELAALACALHARGRPGWAAAGGVAAAAAALTRPEGLIAVAAVALCAGSRRAGLVLVAVAALCIAPWTIRNAVDLHAFVPVSTETGNTLAGTYNAQSLHDAHWRDPRLSHLYVAQRTAHRSSEAATDRALTHAALDFIGHHPLFPVRVAAINVTRLTGLAPTAFSRTSLNTVSLPTGPAPWLRIALLLTAAAALAGALTRAARRAPAGLWLTAAVIAALALLVNAEQRFAVPLVPFAVLLAPLPFTRGR